MTQVLDTEKAPRQTLNWEAGTFCNQQRFLMNQYTPSTTDNPLTCDCCGAPDARPYYVSINSRHGAGEFHSGTNNCGGGACDAAFDQLCRRCAHKRATHDAAFDQLQHAVRLAYHAWRDTWETLIKLPDADEILHQIGGNLHNEANKEKN